MKKGLCEIICIADRSGSMETIRSSAIEAFNGFLQNQKNHPGEAILTYIQFDDQYEIVHLGKPIHSVEKLTSETFVPRGSTSLLDAIGKTIDNVGARLRDTMDAQRPERIIVTILTDGGENSSHVYTRSKVFEMIRHQREKYSWEFVFLAAGPDAFMEAQQLGIPQQFICAYAANDAVAHLAATNKMSSSVGSYRSGGSATINPTVNAS